MRRAAVQEETWTLLSLPAAMTSDDRGERIRVKIGEIALIGEGTKARKAPPKLPHVQHGLLGLRAEPLVPLIAHRSPAL